MKVEERPIEEKSRKAIELKLDGMGEYVRMSYLQRALKSGLDFETKKFVLIRLAGIFEAKGMFLEAAKLVKTAAEINTTFRDKIRDFMKSVELYIKGGNFNEADILFRQSLALGSQNEKSEMKVNLKNYYLTQAKIYTSVDKRSQAKKTYERILSLELDVEEKREVQARLLEMYDKLGHVREYYNLKKVM